MNTAHTHPDGTITLDVDPIRRIDIEDIDALDSFSRKTQRDVTTLEVHFCGGGKFKISYSSAGKIIEAGGHKIGILSLGVKVRHNLIGFDGLLNRVR